VREVISLPLCSAEIDAPPCTVAAPPDFPLYLWSPFLLAMAFLTEEGVDGPRTLSLTAVPPHWSFLLTGLFFRPFQLVI